MTNLIPEDVKAALKVLTDSGLEASPGETEDKRERKAREQRNTEHQAMTVLIAHGLDLANRLVAALEEIAERGHEPRNG